MRKLLSIIVTLTIISCNQQQEVTLPISPAKVEIKSEPSQEAQQALIPDNSIHEDTVPKIKWERTYCWNLPVPKTAMNFVEYEKYKIKRDSNGQIIIDSTLTHQMENQGILLDQVRNLIAVVKINKNDTVLNSRFIEYGEFATDSLRDYGINHYKYDPFSIFKVEYLYQLDHDQYLIRHIVDNVEFRRYMFSTWDLKGDSLILNTIIPKAHSVGYHADFMFQFLEQNNDTTYTCLINKTEGEVTQDDQTSPRHINKYKFTWPNSFIEVKNNN